MRKTALAILLSTVSLGACRASEGTISEIRQVPAFSSIALNGIGTVRIRQGQQSVRLTIDPKLADRYETVVKNGKLMIGFTCGSNLFALRAIRKLKNCEVDITVPALEGIELNGQGRIFADSFPFSELRIDLTGAGVIELGGSAAELQIRCTGAGELRAGSLAAKAAHVRLTGAGTVDVRAEEELEASVSGAGTITYWGNPRVTQRVSGAGSIRRANQ
jgi:hypothetical protein